MDVICQYQQIIIYGAVNKGECVILVVKNIQLVYMAIKVVRKKKDALGGNSQKSDSTLTCPTSKMKSNVVSNSKKEFRTQIVAVRQPSLAQTWPGS